MKPPTHKEELRQRNLLGMVNYWGSGWGGGKPLSLSRNVLMQLQTVKQYKQRAKWAAIYKDHYENMPIEIYRKWKFSDKKNLMFFIFLLKI